jgi:hypothetical protein
VSNELMSALEQIEKDQGFPKEEIITMVEQALVSAYRKHAGQMVNVVATIDTDSGQISAYVVKAIVETVTNPLVEITAAEAARVSHGVVEGCGTADPRGRPGFCPDRGPDRQTGVGAKSAGNPAGNLFTRNTNPKKGP